MVFPKRSVLEKKYVDALLPWLPNKFLLDIRQGRCASHKQKWSALLPHFNVIHHVTCCLHLKRPYSCSLCNSKLANYVLFRRVQEAKQTNRYLISAATMKCVNPRWDGQQNSATVQDNGTVNKRKYLYTYTSDAHVTLSISLWQTTFLL